MPTPMTCPTSARIQRMEIPNAPFALSSIPIAGRAFFPRLPLLPLLLISSITFIGQAQAQTLPDAGSLQRETGRSLQTPPHAEQPKATPISPAIAQDTQATRVTVKQIIVDGAHLIPAAELEGSLSSLKGQSLTLSELEHAIQRIAERYRSQGWYVRVYLPQQDVTQGIIHIQVLEGSYGGSRINNQSQRAQGDYIQNIVTHRLTPNTPLSASDLERGLLLANDLPGIRAVGILEAGEHPGQTRVQIKVEDTPLLTGDLALNNHGVKSTGRAQLTGGISLNDLNGRGDQLSLRGLAADRLKNAQLRYSLPIGNDGWRIGANYSSLKYTLGGQYSTLDANGTTQIAGLTSSYPLIRQAQHNLTLSGNYEQRRYDDNMLNTPLHRHRIDALILGLNGDLRDTLGGGGITWGSLNLTQGKLKLDSLASDLAQDTVGPRSQGNYTKLNGQINRLQALGSSGWQLRGSLAGQAASHNLASAERFSLGGPYGVRAYPVNEGNGDEGMLLNLELQHPLDNGWQVIGFLDSGRIRQHQSPWAGWQGGSNTPNSYSLSGIGIGLNWNKDGWQAALSIATPIGHNPGRNAQDRNNDGSKASDSRLWLTLSHYF